ncbi:MAG: S53 family peptidase [Streptosporangiaceae bacterium]
MRAARLWALTGSLGLVASVMAAGSASAAAKPVPTRMALQGSVAPAQARAHPDGKVSASSQVGFDLVLKLRNAAGAKAFATEVSTPGSALFHHYLSDAQWTARFGPTKAEVTRAQAWLRSAGFSVGAVAKDRLFVPAQGSAQKVESAFGAQLGYYRVNGKQVRLTKSTLTVPAALAGTISGATGINETLATNDLSQTLKPSATAVKANQEPAPPAGFRNPQPCSHYWGQKTDTTDSAKLYAPYTSADYDICGYSPSQLRGAYGVGNGTDNGTGVTIAIVDAYDSPTLLADAQEYFSKNDPKHPLLSSQFTNMEPTKISDQAECGASGWYPEQALDLESSHSMAPGADIVFVGARNCLDTGLLSAVDTAVTSGASVVSDSWGDTLGDLLTDQATRTAFDNEFLMADGSGVSILYSSGDSGDNFADFGLTASNYPPSSPYITAVGGTTLEVGAGEKAIGQYGWSTARQIMCESTTTNCGSATTPAGGLSEDGGGGGGTSYQYAEPTYQDAVVPAALADRNASVTGEANRVEPDISMDADAQSGLLIGLTQTFSNGVYYSQFKEGGTSLASPLLAGVIADTDQASGTSLGFLNPELYKAYTATPGAFNDITAQAHPDATDVIRVDYANEVNATHGYLVSVRAITYEGPETYCDGTGNCATRDNTLSTAPGFDSMTGLGAVSSSFIQALSKY